MRRVTASSPLRSTSSPSSKRSISVSPGTASGVRNALQQLGGAVGVAVLGTVFFDRVEADGGFLTGMRAVSWLAVAVVAGTLLVSVLMPREARPDSEH